MSLRTCPPMLEKRPPAYTVEPLTARALTPEPGSLAFGFQAVAVPVTASSAALLLRACPPMLVKSPPAYTAEPLTAGVWTCERAFGFHAVAAMVTESSAVMLMRELPQMKLKAPPA